MISDYRIVNSRRQVLRVRQTVRPALIKIVKEMATNRERIIREESNNRRAVSPDNGDREPRWEQPLTLLIDEFLNELGEIPNLVAFRELPINNLLPESTSPIFFDFKVNLGADPATQRIQKLLKSIYKLHNNSVYIRLEIVQRAHWLDLDKKSAYTIRAKAEMEKNYFRY